MTPPTMITRFLLWAKARGVVLARFYEESGLSAQRVDLDHLYNEYVPSNILCAVCKGSNVQTVSWVDANTGEVFEDYWSWNNTDGHWCNDCGEHVMLMDTALEDEKTHHCDEPDKCDYCRQEKAEYLADQKYDEMRDEQMLKGMEEADGN